MFSKIQILYLVLFCALFATANAQNAKHQTPLPSLVADDYYYSGNNDGKVQHNYEVLRVFIVNRSKDTLKYWGTRRLFRTFFDVTGSPNLQVANPDVSAPPYEQIVIPPHHSQRLQLKLAIAKVITGTVDLAITMKFYKWFPTKNLEQDLKTHQPVILTDNIELNFKDDGRDFDVAHAATEEKDAKAKFILPTTDLYELTAAERKKYTLSIDEKKIKKAPKNEYNYKVETVILVPVAVHNRGKDTLTYFSMSCSGLDYYHIDNHKFKVVFSPCDNNVPKEVVILPGQTRLVTVPVVYKNSSVKPHETFKIGLSINKNVTPNPFDFDADELTRFNIVWSNGVHLPD